MLTMLTAVGELCLTLPASNGHQISFLKWESAAALQAICKLFA